MAVNILGVIAVAVFYILILAIGVYAGRKTAKSGTTEELLIADRGLGLIVSFFTMTATMVGGAFINGTAEIIASSGIVWTQAPVGYCLSFIIGGLFFAPQMREAGYFTMFDPFQQKLGKYAGAVLCIPQFLSDLFWTAAVLAALGSTISIILDINQTLAIIISSCIAVFYTFLGGLWSVAYTDVIQLICIAVGLVTAVPFAMTHPAVDYTRINTTWKGEIQPTQIGSYFDIYCLLIFGGIPWQVYIQRCLACKTPQRARIASFVASIGCFLFAVPAACLGITAAATDWNQTTYGGDVPIPAKMMSYVLPLALQHLCPAPVAIIGLGAISAAVMSSADSSILSSASVFAMNIYKPMFRQQASDREISWVIRISVLVCGLLSTLVAMSARSVYGLYVLCSDLMYVIMFPQLICILYFKGTNAYGSITAFVVSFTLRIVGGESLLNLPALVHYPFYSPEHGQNFPFRTFAMITSLLIIVSLSKLTEMLFRKNLIPKKYDVFICFRDNVRENGELNKSKTPRIFISFAMDDMSDAKRRPGFEET